MSVRAAAAVRPGSHGDDLILVLGMGRSGSSALARVLSLCGARLPERLLPANASNPTGFWEPQDAINLNARFLRDTGSSFFDTQLVRSPGLESAAGRAFVAEVATLLSSYRHMDAGVPLVVKEPRISLLLPFWLAAAEAAGLAPAVVIPIRHPDEVAASLARWKRVGHDHAAELWLKYNLLAERHSRHLPRCFVAYPALLADWRSEVDRIGRALPITLTRDLRVDDFLDPTLRTGGSGAARTSSMPWLSEVYAAFDAACREAPLNIGLLDAAFAERAAAQAEGTMPVIRSHGVDFGLS